MGSLTDDEVTMIYEKAMHSAKDTKGKVANAVILTADYIERKVRVRA